MIGILTYHSGFLSGEPTLLIRHCSMLTSLKPEPIAAPQPKDSPIMCPMTNNTKTCQGKANVCNRAARQARAISALTIGRGNGGFVAPRILSSSGRAIAESVASSIYCYSINM